MKKRVLSLLLLFAMLVTMVPAMAIFGSAEEGAEEELPRSETFTDVESFYDLYETEGLLAFFDALDPANGTLDLANGKWYAKVYDPDTKSFVTSQTIYATINGGAYADDNPTGWKAGASGFGFADPDNKASSNSIVFNHTKLLAYQMGPSTIRYANWTVDTTLQTNLRSIPPEYRTYTVDGEAALTVVTEGDDLGTYAAKTTLVAPKWGTQKNATVVLNGVAGESATVNTIVSGGEETPVETAFNATFDAEGKATISVPFCNGAKAVLRDIAIYTPADVSVESVTTTVNNTSILAASSSAFQFGPVSAHYWTNKLGEDYSGGGNGTCRWSITTKPGEYSGDRIMLLAPGVTNEWTNSAVFKNADGKITTMVANKVTAANGDVTYSVVHDGNLHSGKHTSGMYSTYKDLGFKLLEKAPGTVYTVRVYASNTAQALSDDAAAKNASADLLIRLGVGVDKFNEMNDALKDEFLTKSLPKVAASATKESVEKLIDELVLFEAQKENAKKLSVYDELYVGADGSTTANGGKLLSLFTAFQDDVSVNLNGGSWINKIGNVDATFGNAHYWERRSDGAVGYTGFYGQVSADGTLSTSASTNNISAGASSFTNTRLNLGLELLPKDDYTIEYVAKYMPIYVADSEGNIAKDASGEPLEYYNATGEGVGSAQYAGAIDYIGFISSWQVSRDGHYKSSMTRGSVVWMLKNGNASWGTSVNWVGGGAFDYSAGLYVPALRENGAIHTYVVTRDEEVSFDGDGTRVVSATYALHRDSALMRSESLSTANTEKGKEYFDADDPIDFYLSSMLPTDFYSVRIYDAVLTEEELAYNTFVDMAAYVAANLNDFKILDEEKQALVIGLMAGGGFPTDAVAFAAQLASAVEIYEDPVTAKDSLYVTDGLRVLTAAYNHFHTGAISSEGGISWFNAVKVGEYINVKGKGWNLRPDGGYYMIKDYTEFSKDRNFGLYLTPEMLPEDDYTVEVVINPTGIVNYNEDGTYSRYVDEETTYGLHYEHGFTIGPLRCLIFPADGLGGQRAGMEKRWCYDRGTRCWEVDNPKRNHIFTESAWKNVGIDEVVSYAITFSKDTAAQKLTYKIYNNLEISNTKQIEMAQMITNEQADNMFQLMCSQPGGVFSVRVYDRVLTEAERIQNRVADVIYYYDLDLTKFEEISKFFKDDKSKLFRGLSSLSFDMSKDEAQEIFDARLSALWLSFSEMGVRNDSTEGMRYYFDMDESTATIMINNGFKVEIGAIVNLGQNALPTIGDRNYDYRIVAYDSIGGKNSGFFIDDDTFAVTIQADSMSKEALLTSVQVRGYILLTAPDGTPMEPFYADPVGDGYSPESFFEVYDYMMDVLAQTGEYDVLNYLSDATDVCYERSYVYLQAGAPAGGDGTKDKPYNNFKDAFMGAKAALLNLNKPTYLYLRAGDGIYEMSEVLSIDGSEIPYRYSRFILTSANNRSTLTSNKQIDNSKFTQDGNIWVYQFDQDASGNYPNFRYLYVNGEIADIAHNGAAYINEDATRYNSPFYRYQDGPLIVATNMYNAGTLTVDELYYPAEKVALRSRFAYYRDWYMAYDEVMKAYDEGLLNLDSQTTVENPTTNYLSFYEDFKYNRTAVLEFQKLYDSEEIDKFDGKLYNKIKEEGFTTSQPNPSEDYLNVFKEVLKSLKSDLGEGKTFKTATSKITLSLPRAFSTSEAQDQRLSAFSSGVYKQVKNLYVAGALTHESVPNVREAELAQGEQFLYYRDAFLALDEAKAAFAVIDAHNDQVDSIKKANAEAEAWNAANPNAAVQKEILPVPEYQTEATPVATGSEQFKELFDYYLHKLLAIDELTAKEKELKGISYQTIKHGEFTYKSAIGTYETKYTNASDAYVAVFTEMRDKGMINSTYFTNLKVEVLEAEGPYGGDLPLYDPRDENKVYFQKDLIGNQSFAIEQGSARLADDAAKLLSETYAAYAASYENFMTTQKHHENLVYLGKLKKEIARLTGLQDEDAVKKLQDEVDRVFAEDSALKATEKEKNSDYFEGQATLYLSTVNNYRNDCLKLYEAYLKAVKTAGEYLDDETNERHTLKDSGLEFKMVVEWNYNIVHVSGVDYGDNIVQDGVEYVAVYALESEYSGFVTHKESYFIERMTTMQFSYSYLDTNNEFYYDRVTGQLYYYSDEGIDGLEFEYPTMQNMLYLTNIERMTITKLAFTGLDDAVITDNGFTGGQASGGNHFNEDLGISDIFPSRAPIYAHTIYDLTIENCNFHDLGCEGITTRMKAKNLTISDNTFRNLGSSAIRIGGTSSGQVAFSERDGAENTLITNNLLDGISLYLFTSPALYMQYAKDIQITYNTIMNCSYTGISIGWNWSAASFMYGESVKLMHCEIAYNYITSFMRELGDGGALYTLGGNAAPEEHRLFNWAHDNYWMCSNTTGDGEQHFFAANYHDGSSANWETYNTVVAAHSYGAAHKKDVYKSPVDEVLDEEFFENIDTNLTMQEYQRRLRNRRGSIYYYYEQTVDGADSFNITLHDNFLLNARVTLTGSDKQGTQHYEMFRGRARESYFIYTINNRSVKFEKDYAEIPYLAEEIIMEAGCDLYDDIYKGDPSQLYDNNY